MKNFKHLLLLMFLSSIIVVGGYAQEEENTKDDKYKNIPKRLHDQKDQFDDGVPDLYDKEFKTLDREYARKIGNCLTFSNNRVRSYCFLLFGSMIFCFLGSVMAAPMPEGNSEAIQFIRDLIASNDISEAISEIKDLIEIKIIYKKDSDDFKLNTRYWDKILNQTVTLSADFQNLEEKWSRGSLAFDDYQRWRGKHINRLLGLINHLNK